MVGIARIFSEGFRIFFLLALLAAVLTLGLWEALLWADFFGSGAPGWHALSTSISAMARQVATENRMERLFIWNGLAGLDQMNAQCSAKR